MLHLSVIENLFKSCEDGTFTASSLSAVKVVTSLRNIDDLSLLDVAIKNKQVCVVCKLLQLDFMSTADGQKSALLMAAKSGDCQIMEMLLTKTDVSTMDMVFPLLMAACRADQRDVLALLIAKYSPSVDHLNQLLQEACRQAHPDIVSELVRAGADIHTYIGMRFLAIVLHKNRINSASHHTEETKTDKMGAVVDVLTRNGLDIDFSLPALWKTIGSFGSLSLLNFCFSRSTDMNAMPKVLLEAVRGACAAAHVEAVELLLEHARVNQIKLNVSKLLGTAMGSSGGYLAQKRIVSALLRHNMPVGFDNDRLLTFAAIGDRIDLISQCIESGGNVNYADASDRSVLSYASDPGVVQKLLDAKAAVNTGCISTLRAACESFHPDAVKLLLDAGASLRDGVDSAEDVTPMEFLMSASCPTDRLNDKIAVINMLVDAEISNGSYETPDNVLNVCIRECNDANVDVIIRALLEHHPDMLERRDKLDNRTPLLSVLPASASASTRYVKYKALIDAGADVNVVDRMGNTAFTSVCGSRMRHTEKRAILRLFLDAGVDATVCDDSGMSMLMLVLNAWGVDASGNKQVMPDSAIRVLCSDVIDHVLSMSS